MTLRHMRIFVEVYHQNSITKAAQMLHLAQPSVSLAIGELESYYGIRLFDRISKRLYVTEQGKQFYGYAIHIVSLFDEMEKGIRNWDSLGILRVGTSITIGNYILPNLIGQFKQIHPSVKVQVFIKNTAAIEQYILNNEIDLALIEEIPESAQIHSIPFMSDPLCLITSPNHPLTKKPDITLEDILAYDLLLREKGSAGRELLESLFTLHHLSVTPLWESVSTQAIVNAVSQGIGISFLPYLLIKPDLEQGKIREIPYGNPPLCRDFSIIYHKNKYISNLSKTLIDLCKSYHL